MQIDDTSALWGFGPYILYQNISALALKYNA